MVEKFLSEIVALPRNLKLEKVLDMNRGIREVFLALESAHAVTMSLVF